MKSRLCLPKISSRSSSHRINNIQVVPLSSGQSHEGHESKHVTLLHAAVIRNRESCKSPESFYAPAAEHLDPQPRSYVFKQIHFLDTTSSAKAPNTESPEFFGRLRRPRSHGMSARAIR